MKSIAKVFLIQMTLIFLSCSSKVVEKNMPTDIKITEMKDTGYVFNPYAFSQEVFLIDLNEYNYFNNSKEGLLLNISSGSEAPDVFEWSVILLNEYMDLSGKKTYIKSSFWDEGNDNAGFMREIPEKIDLLFTYNPIISDYIFENDSSILHMNLCIQFVFGQSLDCKFLQNPKFSQIYTLFSGDVICKDFEDKSILFKGCLVRSIVEENIQNFDNQNKNIYYSLNQIIVSLEYSFKNNPNVFNMVYFHPTCSAYDDGEEILLKIDSFYSSPQHPK